MKKFVMLSAIVIVLIALAFSINGFTGMVQTVVVHDGSKECIKVTKVASGKDCDDRLVATMATGNDCNDKDGIKVRSVKQCGSSATGMKASRNIECPYSGAVLYTDDDKKACDDNKISVHASIGSSDLD